MSALFILLGIVGGIVIVVNPFIGLLVTVGLFPQALIPSMGYSFLGAFSMMTPIKIIGAVTFLATVIHLLIQGRSWSFLKSSGFKIYSIYLVYLYIDGFAQPTSFSRELFTTFTSFWVFGFTILALITTPQRLRLLTIVAVISMAVASAQSVLSFLTRPDYLLMMSRLRGTNFDPNYFAISLLPFIVISFYVGLAEKNKIVKLLLLFIPVILVTALILTQSRGGLLGLAVMLLFAIIRAKNKFSALITVGVLSFILVSVMPQTVWERFEKTRLENSHDDTIGSTVRRYYLAMAAWEMFLDYPIFGSGPGNYYYNCRLYYPLSPGRAHSLYLEIMAEMGSVGLILFLSVLFSALRHANRVIKSGIKPYDSYARGVFLGLIAFMVAALFLHAQQEKTLWLVVFLSLALTHLSQNPGPEKNDVKVRK